MDEVFTCRTHFEYLKVKLNGVNASRGTKTSFSEFLRIQPAYLSQVLSLKYCLSLEQADLANRFFDHSKEESDFFLLLVSRDRAGSESLFKHFDYQINEVLKKRQSIVERLGRKPEISSEVKSFYYSSWLYSAIHIGCTIPNWGNRKEIAHRLNVPIEVVEKILNFLVENGLIKKAGDTYAASNSWIRIDKGSPLIVNHHTNWRQKAIQNLEVQTDEDLHYSGLFSMDKKTAWRVKDKFLDLIRAEVTEIEKAREEDLFVLGLDFFRLIKK